MQVSILTELWDIENDIDSIKELFIRINTILKLNKRYMDYMTVDGAPVKTDFQDYIEDRIKDISQIDIITISQKRLNDNLLVTANEYLTGTIPQLNGLVDSFYKGASEGSWQKFGDLVEGFLYIHKVTEALSTSETDYNTLNGMLEPFVNDFNIKLVMLLEVAEQRDSLQIADIINYEIKPLLENFNVLLETTIDSEVVRDDLH
ncbi:hypothetical protein SAMN03159341_111120 [Paenibacillus sp. 1_12]|uniref:hypothetical protein n=1 Tax=Paenibacillus sp. 1_12 TaxID=1566278 RepID=UPI0008F2A757|nr:hypothetical protein [Paenibacillus sp. 1_12]SFL89183.1 hypothetical protein SAMN03159341_111120 [Paenibacillus sp. 1_12]